MKLYIRPHPSFVASTPMWLIHPGDPRMTLDVLLPEREASWEKLYVESGFGIWLDNFHNIVIKATNAAISGFIVSGSKPTVGTSRRAPMHAERGAVAHDCSCDAGRTSAGVEEVQA